MRMIPVGVLYGHDGVVCNSNLPYLPRTRKTRRPWRPSFLASDSPAGGSRTALLVISAGEALRLWPCLFLTAASPAKRRR